MNLAAKRPNIGRPICVSDSFIDFFFLNTFSLVSLTTLNSIFPENVEDNDLDTSSNKILTCSSSSPSLPEGYKHNCHSRSMPWAFTLNLSDSMYSPLGTPLTFLLKFVIVHAKS